MIWGKASDETVEIRLGPARLEGLLQIPSTPVGMVLFAHGSGSSRHSSRNRLVAHELQGAGLGTLLVDLLTEEEDRVYARRFEIPFLAERLGALTRWLKERLSERELRIGYFGASTGAAAALLASVREGPAVAAIVSRGGRPDLVGDILPEVQAPTLFIVGGKDEPVTSLNIEAYRRLRATRELSTIRGATHLFEEPGALEEVARLSARWFRRFLPPPAAEAAGAP